MAESEGAFRLTFLQGRGLLSLGGRDIEGLGRVDALELEIPDLRFPFDLSGGVARFKNRRLRLRELSLFVGSKELTEILRRAPLGDFGIFDPQVHVAGSHLTLTARAQLGGHECEVTVAALVSPQPPRAASLCVYDVRIYGFLPVPGPLIVTALFAALGAEPPSRDGSESDSALRPLVHLNSAADIRIEACELAMLAILPMHGWRLPERKHVQIRVAGGAADAIRVPLVFASVDPDTSADLLLGEDASPDAHLVREFATRCAPVENALARGDVTSALMLLSAQAPLAADDRVGTTRLLQLLLAAPVTLDQAAELAQAALARWPDFVAAPLAQAVVAEVGGRFVEAAAAYEKVALSSTEQGRIADASCARVAAARALAACGQADRALVALEQGLVDRPGLGPVGRARVMKRAAEGGWSEIVRSIGDESLVGEPEETDEVVQLVEIARQGGVDQDLEVISQAASSLEGLLLRDGWAESALSRADAAYQLALARLALGEADAAAYWLGVCIESDAGGSTVALAWRELVEILRRRGDWSAVAQALAGWAADARTAESPAVKVEHLLDAGRIAWRDLARLSQAADYLDLALATVPADERALALLEELAQKAGAVDRAIEILRRNLRDTRPDQGKRVLRMLIRLLVAAGNRQAEAGEACNVLRDLAPDDEEAVFYGARLAWDVGERDLAVERYGALLQATAPSASGGPYRAEAYLRLAQTALDRGQAESAETYLAQGLADEPHGARVEVVVETLRAFGHSARIHDLLAARESSLADDGERRQMRRSLALAAEMRGDLAEAERGYVELLRATPDDLDLLERMANLCKRQSRADEVVHWLGKLWEAVRREAPASGSERYSVSVGLDLAAALAARPDGKSQAEEILRGLVERVPDDVAPLDAIYQLLVERGDFDEASDVFAKRLALSEPDAVPLLLVSRARLCLAQPEGVAAALEILQTLPAETLDDETLSLRAEVANTAGESVDALLCLQRLRMRASDDERRRFTKRLVEVLSQPQVAKDMAITVLEKLQGESPDDLGVAQALFEAYGRLEDVGARVRLWKELLDHVPSLPDMYRARLRVALSEVAEHDGDLQTAQVMLDEAAALDASPRTKVEHLVAHARLLVARGELSQADGDLEEALRLDPHAASALALLGELAYRAQEWERARNAYARLAQLPAATSTLSPSMLAYRRAELAEMFGDHAEAEAAYREVIAADPAHDGAREALAGFAFLRGEFAEAALQLEEVARAVPKEAIERLTHVRHRLGQVYMGLGDLQAARQNLELALASEPDRASTLELLAATYSRLGLHRDAGSMCERLSRILTDPAKKAEALHRKGEILRTSLGDVEGAADAYLRACDLDPSFAPTLGRLASYYWSRADLPSLADIGGDLVAANLTAKPDQDDLGLLVAIAALLSRHDERLAQSALESPVLGAPLRAELAVRPLADIVTKVARADIAALDVVVSFVSGLLGPGFKDHLIDVATKALVANPGDAGLAVLAGRLFERRGQRVLARAAYSLAQFIDPEVGAEKLLADVGDEAWPRPGALAVGQSVHPLCQGPLRTILQHLARALAHATTPSYDESAGKLQPATLAICEDLQRQLGSPVIPAVAQGHGTDVTFTATQPLSLLVGRRAESLPASELRFLVARAFEQVRAGTLAVLRMTPENLRGMLRAVLRIAGAPATPFEIAEEAADEATSLWLRRLRHPDIAPLLPIAQHRDDLIAEAKLALADSPDLDEYIRGCRYTADRVGLVASARPQAALRAVCGSHKESGEAMTASERQEHLRSSQALRELVAFMLSDAYEALVAS